MEKEVYDAARCALEAYPSGDARIRARLTLDMARREQPPSQNMVRDAIQIWPQDAFIRCHGERMEDLVALVGDLSSDDPPGLLERDDKMYGKYCYELAWAFKES